MYGIYTKYGISLQKLAKIWYRTQIDRNVNQHFETG